ncbi:MAG: Dna2/Cas4 domain-containing protein [Candidatus Aenigmatarchaeota archaeon]
MASEDKLYGRMLKERIDTFYRREEKDKERDYFYASEVCDCKRKIYFKVKGAEKEELDPVTNRKFERGNQIHQRLVSVLYSLGIVTASEVEMPDQSLFHGRADAIVSINDENYVVEIKSTSPYSFKSLDGPKESWEKQLQLYLHHFDIDQGIILVECKGTQKLEEFRVERNDETVEELEEEFRKLRDMIKKDVVPKKPDKSDWSFDKCKYCLYENACKETSNSLKGFTGE